MRNVTLVLLVSVLVLAGGCSHKYEENRIMMHQPINCKTAEGDIRMLMHEKAHVEEQIMNGVTAITPAGLVVGLATGTEDDKMKVASGEYNEKIDARIEEIKKHCGLE